MARFDLADVEREGPPAVGQAARGEAGGGSQGHEGDILARYAPQTPCGNRFNRWRRARIFQQYQKLIKAAS